MAVGPALIGLILEHQPTFGKLYAVLPLIMLVEVLLLIGATIAAGWGGAAAYYLVMAIVMGLASATVTYLLQKVKETRIPERAIFDRRTGVADGLGHLLGSGVAILCTTLISSVAVVALLGVVQTVVAYAATTLAIKHR